MIRAYSSRAEVVRIASSPMAAISTQFLRAMHARRTRLKITEAGELVICSEVGDVLARHRILFGRQERSVQVDHYRGLGTPVSRVEQASAVQELRPAERTMFWDAPVVEVRPLSAYDCLLGEVS
jgi:hypothetical protein